MFVILEAVNSTQTTINPEIKWLIYLELFVRTILFFVGIISSFIVGEVITKFLKRVSKSKRSYLNFLRIKKYHKFSKDLLYLIRLLLGLIFTIFSFSILEKYAPFHDVLGFIFYLGWVAIIGYTISKIALNYIRDLFYFKIQHSKVKLDNKYFFLLENIINFLIITLIIFIGLNFLEQPSVSLISHLPKNDTIIYSIQFARRLGFFLLWIIIATVLGLWLPQILPYLLKLLKISEFVVELMTRIQTSITIISLGICYQILFNSFVIKFILENHRVINETLIRIDDNIFDFLSWVFNLAVSIGFALLASEILKFIRLFIINVLQDRFGKINEVIFIIETFIYTGILLCTVIFLIVLQLKDKAPELISAFSTSLLAGSAFLGFILQPYFAKIAGTIEIYLDTPYVSGEYIRVTFNPYAEDVYARVESIGIRSTKIRIVGKNTLMIVPNSIMADKNIENITRGKKIMAMLCLDFMKILKESEKALVKQIVQHSSNTYWSFDKTNTTIHFNSQDNPKGTRARVIFFITGSGEKSIELRKCLLELANNDVRKRLNAYNLSFTVPEPMIYIDSPMSI